MRKYRRLSYTERVRAYVRAGYAEEVARECARLDIDAENAPTDPIDPHPPRLPNPERLVWE